ncbi:MAG: glycosyltransferase family 1 protein [Patescibacteria group bacterium]
MIIGIDASRANKKAKTGVEWYAFHLIEQLKKIDQANRYFLYTNEKLQAPLAVCPNNFFEKVLKWPLRKFWTLGRLSLEMFFGERPDILFVPAHTLPFRKAKKKTVVTIHDIGFEHFPKLYNWPAKIYHKFSIQIIKKLADKIITVSEFCKNDLIDVYNLPADKIEVVYNGFDNEKYFVRDSFEKLCQDSYVLFIGRIEEKKNMPRLIEAFAEFKKKDATNLKLVLVGLPGFGIQKVKENIEKFNLQNEVILTGWQAEENLLNWLAGARMFVFPSLFEGFGIPIIEAMAMGIPVACSKTTALGEIAGDSALTFDPEDTGAIAEAIFSLNTNEALRLNLREKGLKRAVDFSWEKCAGETLKVLLS